MGAASTGRPASVSFDHPTFIPVVTSKAWRKVPASPAGSRPRSAKRCSSQRVVSSRPPFRRRVPPDRRPRASSRPASTAGRARRGPPRALRARDPLPAVPLRPGRVSDGCSRAEGPAPRAGSVRAPWRCPPVVAAASALEPAAGASGASTQRAMKRLVSWLPSALARLEPKMSWLPSGLNMGKPSKPGAWVTRRRPVPSLFTIHRSNSRPRGSPALVEKSSRWPSGNQ